MKNLQISSLVGGSDIFSDVVQLSFTYVECYVGPENLFIFLSDCKTSCRAWNLFETPCSIVFYRHSHHSQPKSNSNDPRENFENFHSRASFAVFPRYCVCMVELSHRRISCQGCSMSEVMSETYRVVGPNLVLLVEKRWKRYDWEFISCRVKSQPAAKVKFSRSIWTSTYIYVSRGATKRSGKSIFLPANATADTVNEFANTKVSETRASRKKCRRVKHDQHVILKK